MVPPGPLNLFLAPWDKPFHLPLNVAVGGEWGGQKGIDADAFPQQMLVDYVRFYQMKKE